MQIESGTTTERLVRSSLVFFIFAGGSAWFAYDGWKGWPEQNKREFLLEFQEDKAAAARGPVYVSVTKESLDQARERMGRVESSAKKKQALAELYGGPPSYENDKAWYYFGPAYRVDVLLRQGDPIDVSGRAGQRNSLELAAQKWLAAALCLAALCWLWFLFRIRATRLVLDETGLSYRSHGPIRWEDMKELDLSRFAKKGTVDLVHDDHGTRRSIRLDEYHLAAFDEVINALCIRKGFENPLPANEFPADESAVANRTDG